MNSKTLEKAIKIKKEIEELEAEIRLLPITTHNRMLREILNGVLRRNHNKLYVVETYTYNNEVVMLNKEDIELLVNIRLKRIENLKKELESM